MATFPIGTQENNLANPAHTAYNPVASTVAPSAIMQSILTGLKQIANWLKNTLTVDMNMKSIVVRDSVQAIPTGTWTTILFPADYYDPSNMHSTVSNTGRLTLPSTFGASLLTEINMSMKFADDTTGNIRAFRLVKNATVGSPAGVAIAGISAGTTQISSAGASGGQWSASAVMYDNASSNDYYELQVFHNKGTNLNVDWAFFSIEKVL